MDTCILHYGTHSEKSSRKEKENGFRFCCIPQVHDGLAFVSERIPLRKMHILVFSSRTHLALVPIIYLKMALLQWRGCCLSVQGVSRSIFLRPLSAVRRMATAKRETVVKRPKKLSFVGRWGSVDLGRWQRKRYVISMWDR